MQRPISCQRRGRRTWKANRTWELGLRTLAKLRAPQSPSRWWSSPCSRLPVRHLAGSVRDMHPVLTILEDEPEFPDATVHLPCDSCKLLVSKGHSVCKPFGINAVDVLLESNVAGRH